MGGSGAFTKYWTWWGRLLFQDAHHAIVTTSPMLACSVGGCAFAFWAIWKSVAYDPEVRIRPHKKAWHQTESRINGATKYRHGAFAFYYKTFRPTRWRHEQKRLESAFEDDKLRIPKE